MTADRPIKKKKKEPVAKPILKKDRQQGNQDQTSNTDNDRRSNPRGNRPNVRRVNNPEKPSIWMTNRLQQEPQPSPSASFVEYLRWMRSPEQHSPDATKSILLQLAEEKSLQKPVIESPKPDQQPEQAHRLKILTNRTKRLARGKYWFEATCAWRIRVGGHRGPESMLLPAFDALGMPYIPSSSLRGVARKQAIMETMTSENIEWEEAEKKIAQYFGSLEATSDHRTGKVTFLDAYPLPGTNGPGLSVDMANNIWSWEGKSVPEYNPNPNVFLSLRRSTFVIGAIPGQHCTQEEYDKILHWLKLGLRNGLGSQVNSGYGSLISSGYHQVAHKPFLQLDFSLQGQLIHSCQEYRKKPWNAQKKRFEREKARAEVRSIAFKSMLRYWFRTIALGYLRSKDTQALEAKIFGSINPREYGWLTVRVELGRHLEAEKADSEEDNGVQLGTLQLFTSSRVDDSNRIALEQLLTSLTWIMFHLGGVGQGARRPLYQRSKKPYQRGSKLRLLYNTRFEDLPLSPEGVCDQFKTHINNFVDALSKIAKVNLLINSPIGGRQSSPSSWNESLNKDCQIIVCNGRSKHSEKPFALYVLHKLFHELEKDKQNKDQERTPSYLCGGRIKRKSVPSPIWISAFENYQVVTVFGANSKPRKAFLEELKKNSQSYYQIWPIG